MEICHQLGEESIAGERKLDAQLKWLFRQKDQFHP
jgi:hypothetical protein